MVVDVCSMCKCATCYNKECPFFCKKDSPCEVVEECREYKGGRFNG